MLNASETAALLSLLGQEHLPLDRIIAAFTSQFKRHLHFKACCCLVLLLEDRPLLKQPQRLVAFYILYGLYCVEQPITNPFMTVLVKAASDEMAEKVERAFVLQLLDSISNNNKEFHRGTAYEFITTFDSATHNLLSLEHLQRQFADRLPVELSMNCFKRAAISNVVPAPDFPRGHDPDIPEVQIQGGPKKIGAWDREEAAAVLIQNSSLKGLEPPWVRPFPPQLPPQEGEIIWLTPDSNHELLWDYGMCANKSRGLIIRELIANALKGALAPDQLQQVLKEFEADPELVSQCGLTPRWLPKLVENNPTIAVEMLPKLINPVQTSETSTCRIDSFVWCVFFFIV